ncbi:MAG: exo-alpha-sialidase [Clostridia bacterium]|nr:exo-alpha-sialidase [Clostridia bacterium]
MILEKPDKDYSFYRIPGLVATAKGTLLAYYECRSSLSDWAKIDIKINRSTDGGKTWETAHIERGEGNTLNNPVMIVDGETVYFLYCKNYERVYLLKSTNDGLSFGEKSEISAVFDGLGEYYSVVALGPGHGIKFGDKLILPVWFAQNPHDSKAHHPSKVATIYMQNGEWETGEIISGEMPDPSESSLAVAGDRVCIAMRHEDGVRRVAISYSNDGISGWTKPRFTDIPDPICQGSMINHGNSIYHINCADEKQRINLTVKRVDKDFCVLSKTLIDEVGGYADMAVIDDELCVLYERDAFNSGTLHFTKIKLGKDDENS